MADGARSDHPRVQAQLDRLAGLSPGKDTLGLDRITRLLALLGNPEHALPPAFHVAGTNGKGSTCAYLRAMLEADGLIVHAFTSPHLVRYNERIRVAGTLIDDEALADLMTEVLDANDCVGASFFETSTVTALLAFTRTPADAVIFEVGLGGRLDATNVLPSPVACGITSLGIDHKEFLLQPHAGAPADPMARIAWEKAGIAKPGSPLVTQAYAPEMQAAIRAVADAAGAPVFARGQAWTSAIVRDRIHYRDANGGLILPLPALAGAHQADNAALAVAMLRHQKTVRARPEAMAEGLVAARWPARLQQLPDGRLTALVAGAAITLDGGHNADAARRIAGWVRDTSAPGERLPVVLGLMANKELEAVLGAWRDLPVDITAIPIPGKTSHAPQAVAAAACALGLPATTSPDLTSALKALADTRPPRILIAGSLYLAGEVLRENGTPPD